MKYSEASVKSIRSILDELKSSTSGLSSAQAKSGLEKYGFNELEISTATLYSILFKHLSSPFVIMLLLAAIISLLIGEISNAIIIMIFVFLNISLGFFQEAKAHKAAEILKKYISAKVLVVRSNKRITIEKKYLVPGDVVFLTQWDVVPADIRIMESSNLLVDESILSGESSYTSKISDVLKHEPRSVFQAKNILFAGSTITGGEALGIVIATAKKTELGDIAKFTTAISSEGNYGKKLNKLYNTILKVSVISIVIIFIARLVIKGHVQMMEFTIFVVALLVGIVPEALPTVVTFSLSLGALKLAKQHVIIKRLAAIGDLGDTEILCTDKTGTLTENTLTFDQVFADDPEKCFLFGLLSMSNNGHNSESLKTPFDIALDKQVSAEIKKKFKDYIFLSAMSFDPAKMYGGIKVQTKDGKLFVIFKGIPEKLIQFSSNLSAEQKDRFIKQLTEVGLAGKRTLGVAFKEVINGVLEEKDFNFLGFFSFGDPLKKQTKKAIEEAFQLGLKIKILTGDNKLVAAAVAKEVGLISNIEEVINGDELEGLSDQAFLQACKEHSVFARISPQMKYKIVKELQEEYNVAFLGDGVNDAPALKISHVGITVKEAVSLAREASDIILLKKNLMVLVDGIKEGRVIFANINKFIMCTLASNFGNCYSMAFLSVILPFVPILPIQILLVNLLSDFPLIAIATDSVDINELQKPQQYYIAKFVPFIVTLALVSSSFDFMFFGTFFNSMRPESLRTFWFIMSIFTEILLIYSIRTSKFFLRAKAPSIWLLLSTVCALAVTITLPFTRLGRNLFGFNSEITGHQLALFVFLIIGYFVTTETVKLLFFKFKPMNVEQ
ncbi:MAG: Cation-transporting P-type ATPase [candidate division TM6 bacterium GW2011_GWF2_32_72]|nr:MAG: Cation-transporting P-type ATPase [candidate division TM6 bacterium GW2011_GWF2_32_72]